MILPTKNGGEFCVKCPIKSLSKVPAPNFRKEYTYHVTFENGLGAEVDAETYEQLKALFDCATVAEPYVRVCWSCGEKNGAHTRIDCPGAGIFPLKS